MIGPTGHGIATFTKACLHVLNQSPQFDVIEVRTKTPFLHPKELLDLPKEIASVRPDLYFSPSFASLRAPLPCPHALVLHDLIHLHSHNLFHHAYYRLVVRPFAQKGFLATVSETSKKQLMQFIGKEATVLGNQVNLIPGKLPPYLTHRKFFLTLSSTKPHKNLKALLAAYAHYRARSLRPYPLVLSCAVSQEGVLHHPHAHELLAHAACLITPSLEEGFSLPPPEALLAGTPVLVSPIPAHKEILHDLDGVHFLDANWPEALKCAENFAPPPQATQDAIQARFGYEPFRNKLIAFLEQAFL